MEMEGAVEEEAMGMAVGWEREAAVGVEKVVEGLNEGVAMVVAEVGGGEAEVWVVHVEGGVGVVAERALVMGEGRGVVVLEGVRGWRGAVGAGGGTLEGERVGWEEAGGQGRRGGQL